MIKSLSGNDGCKAHIIQKGLAPIINKALNIHQVYEKLPTFF